MPSSKSPGVDGFIIRSQLEGLSFVTEFLNSPDFDLDALRNISKLCGLSSGNSSKRTLAELIARESVGRPNVKKAIIESLIRPFKKWMAIKKGNLRLPINGCDPFELITGKGEEKWYGPIEQSIEPDCKWYIRPVHLMHWEDLSLLDDHNSSNERRITQSIIRWLCFVRVDGEFVSIHWCGVSHADEASDAPYDTKSQVARWQFIPELFIEVEQQTQSRLDDVRLHRFVLFYLWDMFRYDKKNYVWKDLRIRSETAGVKLNAHSSSVVEHEFGSEQIQGIKKLANTIRLAICEELTTREQYTPIDPEHFDEVILRTLIQDFGALSYEFAIEHASGEKIFRSHSYFGVRPEQDSVDKFPHLQVFKSYGDYIAQLKFLLSHLRINNDNQDKLTQNTLF